VLFVIFGILILVVLLKFIWTDFTGMWRRGTRRGWKEWGCDIARGQRGW